MPSLNAIVDLIHTWFPPATADSWDAVGLVAGDPDQPVAKVMLAVDPTYAVCQEAAAWGADLLVVHHPLLLGGVHSVARTTPKGRALGVLSDAGCALLTAHTNADQAVGGVSESLALRLGLADLHPIVAATGPKLDQLSVFVPTADAEAMRRALAVAGAGVIGDYDEASFSVAGKGRFRPLPGANPAIGEVGRAETVAEQRVETVLERSCRPRVIRAMIAAHPYEEPAYTVVELADPGLATTGAGRIGDVTPTTLVDFVDTVAAALPRTTHGVRVAGEPGRVVRRVAVCGGSGDFLLDEVRAAEVDVYVTSDLKHHRASEFLEHAAAGGGAPALVDVAHWAAEWTWLPVLEKRLRAAFGDAGDTVTTRVSTTCTDPWTHRA